MGNINNMRVTLSRRIFIYSGEPNEPEVSVRLGFDILVQDVDYNIEYLNNLNVGKGIVRITFIGDYADYEGYLDTEFEIEELSIGNATILAGDPDEYGCYNLNNIDVYIENIHLVKDLDYRIKGYTVEEEGNYEITTVILTAIGKNYIEDAIGRFRTRIINPNLKDINDITVEYSHQILYYTGKPIKIELTLKNNDEIMVENKDYELSYPEDIINAGEKIINITGIGENYFGTRIITYDILPQSIQSGILSCGATDGNGNYNTDNITVSFKSRILQKNIDYSYSIEIDSNDKFIFSIVTVSGIGNYTGNIQKTFRTGLTKIDISTVGIRLSQDVFIYNGSLIQPEIITELEEDKDYTITIPDYSISRGEYKVIIKGKGNYDGTLELPYFITSKLISDISIDFGEPDANNCYNIGNMVVSLDGVILKLFVEYNFDVVETDTEEGYIESNCHIYGIGNYEGEFNISVLTGRKTLYPGKKLSLEKMNIYTRYNSQVPETTKTGIYYIWSVDQKDGKVRITSEKEYVGQPGLIVGWINIEDIFNSDAIKIGSKVVVTGNINVYADGTGNTIRKKNEAMYVVDTLDPDQYEYCFGVASGLNRTRQGWATIDMIKRID